MKFKHLNSSQTLDIKNSKFEIFMFVFSKIFSQHAVTTTAQATTSSFEVKIASRGYHVYKNTTWVNANEGIEV